MKTQRQNKKVRKLREGRQRWVPSVRTQSGTHVSGAAGPVAARLHRGNTTDDVTTGSTPGKLQVPAAQGKVSRVLARGPCRMLLVSLHNQDDVLQTPQQRHTGPAAKAEDNLKDP